MLIKTRQGNIICLKERINFKFFSFFIFCAIISKLFNGYLELIIGSSAPCRCFAKDKPVYPKWLVRKLTGVIRVLETHAVCNQILKCPDTAST